MKINRNFLTAVCGGLLLTVALPISADDKGDKKNTSNATPVVVSNKKEVSPFRPKAPSRQSIECMYFDGNLSVDFFIPEGECTMTVTDSNTGISLQYIFSTEESAEIYVGNLSNAYFEFDTEAGNSYEGCLAE